MADKKSKTQQKKKQKEAFAPVGDLQKPLTGNGGLSTRQQFWLAGAIAVLTGLVLSPCLSNLFTNWDDPGYINDNPWIKDLSNTGLTNIFTKPVMGNYHPLTILSYAFEYCFVKLDPWLYHFDSLVLHLLVTFLVYWLISLLTRRPAVAMITALLFGLHPMHVESAAWVSGRKDVLYGVFYIGACIAWVFYSRAAADKKTRFYLLCLALFLLALLSKPVAVALPLSLLVLTYFENGNLDKKDFYAQVPFLLGSLVFGCISIWVQRHAGAMEMHKETYSVAERIALGGYALSAYLWKAVLPIKLCNFYPYPSKTGGSLPILCYAWPVAVALLAILAWKYLRGIRVMVFGLLFFLVNIILLLQFIPVGDAILADRYTYIPYLGLFFIAGWYINWLFENRQKIKPANAILGIFVLYFFVLTYESNERCRVWYDPVSLWRDELDKEPLHAPGAYNNLGFIYYSKWGATQDPVEKQRYYDSASYLLKRGIELQPDFMNDYLSLGEMERNAGKYEEARLNYYAALRIKPRETNLYVGLGILNYLLKNMDSCGYFFRKALEITPSAEAHSNFGNYLVAIGKTDSAVAEYTTAISMTPEMFSLWLNRGKLYEQQQKWDLAISDLSNALKLNPELTEPYVERSKCFNAKGDKALALKDADKAISLGWQPDKNYYESLKR